jgi:hypothetical protein
VVTHWIDSRSILPRRATSTAARPSSGPGARAAYSDATDLLHVDEEQLIATVYEQLPAAPEPFPRVPDQPLSHGTTGQ